MQMDHPIPAKIAGLMLIKKKNCKLVDFAIPVDHKMKIKENGKTDKYLDLVKELKNLWNMKVMVILIVILANHSENERKQKQTNTWILAEN